MMINEELFGYILDFYPNWRRSPQQFIEFIQTTAWFSQLDRSTKDCDYYDSRKIEFELANIFVHVFALGFSYCEKISELQRGIVQPIDINAVLSRMRQAFWQEAELNDLLSGAGAKLSKETLTKELYAKALSKSTIDELRPYIDFW